MRKQIGILTLFFLWSVTAVAQTFEKTDTGIKATIQSVDVQIQFYTPSTIRVVKSPANHAFTKESYSVISKPQVVKLSTRQDGNIVCVKSNELTVELNLETGGLSFFDKKSTPLLKEAGTAHFIEMNDAGSKAFRVKQAFVLDKDEPIYGLGNLENGRLSQRGEHRTLMPGNVEDGITFFQSVKGYGLFWDNYSPTNFADNEGGTSFESEVGDCVDYYFMYGGNADGVVAEMRHLTGQVPMFPLWTYGFWQSRERYKSQAELLEVVNKYRELGIPLDGIIQDWQYWGNNYLWNSMEFMNADFPRPQDMIDEVHAKNAHIIVSIWSSFGPQTKPYKELDAKGM